MIYQAGDIIGTNQLIEKDLEKSAPQRPYWKCKCLLCNQIRSIRTDGFKNKCRSCAAKNREKRPPILDDLTDKQFGFWKVLDKSNKANYWNCLCLNCGTKKEVFRGNLTSGKSKSCGCINSWGETQISYLLNKFNLNFKKEFTFPDLKTDRNGVPRFDFAIFNNNQLFCLIEYDGRQHIKYDKNWKMQEEDFKRLQYIDDLKNNYCIKNNILLYRFNQNTDLEKAIKDISLKIKELKNEV